MRRLAVFTCVAALGALACAPAWAHEGDRAEPRISAQAQGSGFNRTLVVRLTDLDSGDPISGAEVKVRTTMTRPHFMALLPRTLPEQQPAGTYRVAYTFVMPGDWKAEFEVSGAKVVSARGTLDVPIGLSAGTQTTPTPGALPTRLDATVTERDWLSMAILWLHSLAALGWIVGVVVMALALSTRDLLATGARARISAAYRSWGAWLHWASVPVIVATGIYNMVYVSPFKLRWPWDDELGSIPYGKTYEGILIVKLALFVVLLVAGTVMLMRVVWPRAALPGPPRGALRTLVGALGPAGVVYLLAIPAILAAAMALRYVHILSHVAEVVNT